jgi:hypothetical protein
MPYRDLNSSKEPSFTDLNSPASIEIKQLMAEVHHSQELWYKMINFETWALVQTMDDFLPGFWSRFLANRRLVVKQFIEKKRSDQSKSTDH